MGGIWSYTADLEVLREKGPRRVNPFLIPSITVDMPAVQVALRTGAQGPNLGVASACATGADAIGHAFEMIQVGQAQAMFCGGFEAADLLASHHSTGCAPSRAATTSPRKPAVPSTLGAMDL